MAAFNLLTLRNDGVGEALDKYTQHTLQISPGLHKRIAVDSIVPLYNVWLIYQNVRCTAIKLIDLQDRNESLQDVTNTTANLMFENLIGIKAQIIATFALTILINIIPNSKAVIKLAIASMVIPLCINILTYTLCYKALSIQQTELKKISEWKITMASVPGYFSSFLSWLRR